jgi:ATP-binding cassette subfamily B protein
LAIARALLRKPEVLIFDEATSHLDTATERAIQENLRTMLAGKTVVLVAHRLSTVKDADCIYVMHQGRIAEQGSHDQLMAQHGRYAALWRAQTGQKEDLPNGTALFPILGDRTTNGKLIANGASHA